MACVRKRGRQLVIVQGERDPDGGKVRQRILFTIYSKAEALQILGRGNAGRSDPFRHLLEEQYPDIKFDWKELNNAISENLDVLPDLYECRGTRIRLRFRENLCSFAKQRMLADPQHLLSASDLIKDHRIELECLLDLIQWRLEVCDQESSEWNQDHPFHRRFTLQGAGVPPDAEETVAEFYRRGSTRRPRSSFASSSTFSTATPRGTTTWV